MLPAMGTGAWFNPRLGSRNSTSYVAQPKNPKASKQKTGWNQLRSGRAGQVMGTFPPASLPSHLCSSTCWKRLPPMVTLEKTRILFSLCCPYIAITLCSSLPANPDSPRDFAAYSLLAAFPTHWKHPGEEKSQHPT